MINKRFIYTILAALFSLTTSAQTGYLGKRFLVDVNVGASSQAFRVFDYDYQFAWVSKYSLDNGYRLDNNFNTTTVSNKHYWQFFVNLSADVEAILWDMGSAMVEARFNPYSSFLYEDKINSTRYEAYVREADERSMEFGVGYRQYVKKRKSHAPYGRYIQVGVNKVMLDWKRDAMNLDGLDPDDFYKESEYKAQCDHFKKEKLSGDQDFFAGYLELGYNNLFLQRLRVSLSMRTEFPFATDVYKSGMQNQDYYAVRHFWSQNFFQLKAGVGFLIF